MIIHTYVVLLIDKFVINESMPIIDIGNQHKQFVMTIMNEV